MAEVGDLKVKLSLDNAQFERSITQMNKTLQAMGQEIRTLQNKGQAWGSSLDGLKSKQEAYGRLLEGQQTKVKKLAEMYEKAKAEQGEYSNQAQNLATQLNKATAEMTRTERELSEITAELERQQAELNQTKSSWQKFQEAASAAGDKLKSVGSQMKSIGSDLTMKVTAPLTALGIGAAKAAIDFESAFAGVRKTVDASEEGFAKLEKGILEMARKLPASATEIAAVAESAGQLGIAEENILSFTRTIIDLGESTNLTAEQGATEFARFANIVGMSQDNFDRLGSSIVGLGNTMATTEAEIMSMAMRLAGQGAQVGLTEAQILALSATMSSLGINAEAGGTAMSTILKKIQTAAGQGGKSLASFANAAGVTSAEFKTAFETDAAGALDMFIQGLAKSAEGGANLSQVLADLGIKGQYEQDTLLRLAGAADLFGEAMETSATAWEENTALSDEAAQRYETTASQLEMLKNRIVEVGISFGSVMLPFLIQIVETLTPLVTKFAEMDSSIQGVILVIAGIAAAIGPVIVVVGTLVSSIGSIVSAFGAVSTAIASAGGVMAFLSAKLAFLGTAFTALTGPIGLTVAAIVAAATLIYVYWEPIKEFFINLWDSIKEISISVWDGIKEAWSATATFFITLWDGIVTVWNAIVDAIKSAWSVLQSFFTELWTNISTAVMTIIGPFIENTINNFMLAKDSIETIFNALSDYFTAVWDIIKNIVLGAVILIYDLVTGNFEDLKSHATQIWDNIKEAIGTAWEAIKTIISTVLNFIVGKFKNDWNTIKTTTTSVFNAIRTFITTVWNAIKTFFTSTLVNLVKTTVSKFIEIREAIRTKMVEALAAVVEFIGQMPGKVTEKAKEMLSAGKDLVRGLIDGIKQMGEDAIDAVTGVVDGVINKAKSLLGINSPSRVFMEIGEWTGEGMQIGLDSTVKGVMASASKLSNAVINAQASLFSSSARANAISQPSTVNKTVDNSKYMTPNITIVVQGDNTSPSEVARKVLQAQRQLGLEWGV